MVDDSTVKLVNFALYEKLLGEITVYVCMCKKKFIKTGQTHIH